MRVVASGHAGGKVAITVGTSTGERRLTRTHNREGRDRHELRRQWAHHLAGLALGRLSLPQALGRPAM
jgi:hypothetical protein